MPIEPSDGGHAPDSAIRTPTSDADPLPIVADQDGWQRINRDQISLQTISAHGNNSSERRIYRD
jgi:hypothetical protein